MACIQSHLYVYGGTTGFVYNTELHRLNLNNLVWEKIRPNNVVGEVPPERYNETAHNVFLFRILVLRSNVLYCVCCP